MKVEYNLVVDFARPNKSNLIIISEGDRNSRLMHFTLLADKLPMDMVDVSVATVKGIKSDGSVIFGDARILEDSSGSKLNELEYTLPESFTDIAGRTTMTITLMSSEGATITSFEWYVEVRNALYSEDDYISEEDLQGYKDLLNRAMAALEKMEAMVEADALPNPYPINLTIEDQTYNYNGASQIDIELKDMAYIADEVDVEVDALDESAAGSASKSAEEAKESSIAALSSQELSEYYSNKAETYRDEALGYSESSRQSAGLAEAYARQFASDIDSINTRIQALWDAVFPSNS